VASVEEPKEEALRLSRTTRGAVLSPAPPPR
jgi:hypothetical protein